MVEQPLTTEKYYSDLPIRKISLTRLIAKKSLFSLVPEDWHILVADIKDSSLAIKEGKHQQVNLIATGSVIAILNLAADIDVSIPFFFGGDGAVMLVPPRLVDSGMSALNKHKENAFLNFGFDLKIGQLSVEEIYRQGIKMRIAKAKINEIYSIPVIIGPGLQYAENLIKQGQGEENLSINDVPLNLDGMECKWDRIKPPEENQEVISLVVCGFGEEDDPKYLSQVLAAIDDIYGSPRRRKPISVKRLQLNSKVRQINLEMRTKLGKFNGFYILKNWFKNNIGKLYFKLSGTGKDYLEKLVELTDTLTIDGRINTVITGRIDQRKSLISYLDQMEKDKKIKYGLHVSRASIMSCYVKDMSTDDHIHFVDGADGGYTKAANNLKEKL